MRIKPSLLLIPALLLAYTAAAGIPKAEQPTPIWTLSGSPDRMHLRQYTGTSDLKGKAQIEEVELLNAALKQDKPPIRSDTEPRLFSSSRSPNSRYLLCHWVGIWPDSGAHSALCVYDVREKRVLLNLSTAKGSFYDDCDWLNDSEIWYCVPREQKSHTLQDDDYYVVPLATGQPRPMSMQEQHATQAALEVCSKQIDSAAKSFQALGFGAPPAREHGSLAGIASFLGFRGPASRGAVSADGRFSALYVFVVEKNTARYFYQILDGGKCSGKIQDSDLKCDVVWQIRFVGHNLCMSVRKGDQKRVQVWAAEGKPRIVAEFDGDFIVDQSLSDQQTH